MGLYYTRQRTVCDWVTLPNNRNRRNTVNQLHLHFKEKIKRGKKKKGDESRSMRDELISSSPGQCHPLKGREG